MQDRRIYVKWWVEELFPTVVPEHILKQEKVLSHRATWDSRVPGQGKREHRSLAVFTPWLFHYQPSLPVSALRKTIVLLGLQSLEVLISSHVRRVQGQGHTHMPMRAVFFENATLGIQFFAVRKKKKS